MQGMTRKWKTPPATNPANNLQNRILEARGMTSKQECEAFLDPKLLDLEDPSQLYGATCAAKIMATALRDGKKSTRLWRLRC